jgi:hypothetical protein
MTPPNLRMHSLAAAALAAAGLAAACVARAESFCRLLLLP